jgi:hypothetical protein
MRGLALALLVIVVPAAKGGPTDPSEVSARLDAIVAQRCKAAKVTPEPTCDDATFCRRAWLDLAGRVPTALAARQFLDDKSPTKRARLIEQLLSDDDFADHWARLWTQLLTGKRVVRSEQYDGRMLHGYLRQALAADKSYRRIVTELLTAEGMVESSGSANFLLRYEAKPPDLAGAVGKAFLGISLQCAQCHDHPFAKWKKDDFWGVAAYFGRLRLFTHDSEDENLTAVMEKRRGDLMVPDPEGKPGEDGKAPKKIIVPRLPGGEARPASQKRRQALAEWITDDANPYFARNAANQVWSQLFGAPLVRSLDNVEADSPNKDLLDLLATEFQAGGYDWKRLLRVIVLSQCYQRGAGGETAADVRERQRQVFARFPVRPLSVDQLYLSIAQATGHVAPETEDKEDEEGDDKSVESLGQQAQTVQRRLALMNGAYANEAIHAGVKAARVVHGPKLGADHIEWLFLATLSRRPTADESASMLKLAKESKKSRGLEDVLWVLLNSVEFTTNH